MKQEQLKIECQKGAVPYEVFNEKFHVQHICMGSKSFEDSADGKDIMLKGGQETAFEWDPDKKHYHTLITQGDWQRGQKFTPYKLLTMIAFGASERATNTFVRHEYMREDYPYMLCGNDYFHVIKDENRWGAKEKTLKRLSRQTLKDLIKNRGLHHVLNNARYVDFTIEPSNTDFRQVVNSKWNLYSEFPHTPASEPASFEDIPFTWAFMEHIFGDQEQAGWEYMKLLYERPKQILPVLVLVSEERKTGKSTFLKWLRAIFGRNYGIASPEDFKSQFNSHYVRKNIIGIDESVIDKKRSVEKIKFLSTAEKVQVNEKNVSQYEIPFYGKFVMASNKVKDFIKIDKEEIRFWVREVPEVPDDDEITDLLSKLVCEIPKFLRYLNDRIELGEPESRMYFKTKVLENSSLQAVKDESRGWLEQGLEMEITDWFNQNNDESQLFLDAKTIKDRWFDQNNRASLSYIRKVLENKMGMEKLPNARYNIIDLYDTKVCSPYCFNRCDYIDPAEQPPPTNGTAYDTDDVPF